MELLPFEHKNTTANMYSRGVGNYRIVTAPLETDDISC